MSYYAEPIMRLIRELSKLPGIGEKTASRLAIYILKSSNGYAESLAKSLMDVKEKVKACPVCFNLSDRDVCNICTDSGRRNDIVCVVENINNLAAIEKAGGFKGRYHVLNGLLSPLKGISPDDIRIAELVRRVESGDISEVIVATNPNVDGEATALYITKVLKPFGIKVTRIATGIPLGSDLEYIDAATLGLAIEGRREM
ncbi:MAG: recombination protein RecR [Deltaproteobacteria bacterium GWC2_42_11]|nr:MAG: recombination protein RecR [Deltaproteobacteria bacterium GWC2_42_11]HBO84799.1 recombination protein RecR [Deltaproteobacteria bacterium]